MLNYTYLRRDVLTLAHELGHGVHAALGSTQGVFHMATPLTLAETASVFGETLVFGRLLEAAPTPESRLSLLAESIEGSIATVFRQVAMNRFEHLVHTARRDEGELSVDRIGELWAQSQDEMLGDSVEVTEGYRTWWSYVPHFIASPGYVYAYAYGQLLALAVYGRYEEEGPGFADSYLELLQRRRLAVARGAGRDRRCRPRRPGLLGQGPGPRGAQARRRRAGGARGRPPVAGQLRPAAGSRGRSSARTIVATARSERDGLVDRVRELDPGRADHHRRDAAGREEPHVRAPGHAGERRLAPELVAQRAADRRRPTGGPAASPRARRRRPPRRASQGASPSSSAASTRVLQRGAGGVEARADRHAEPALELDPIRDLARPVTAAHAAHEQRVGQRELAHQRMRDVGVDRDLVGARARGARARSGRSPSSPRAARRRGPSVRRRRP